MTIGGLKYNHTKWQINVVGESPSGDQPLAGRRSRYLRTPRPGFARSALLEGVANDPTAAFCKNYAIKPKKESRDRLAR